jgi:HEAT repeat protein
MSLALIEESAKETRRLAIAGSSLAVGDFRLKKLIAPLEQPGAKAPVFGQVAKAIGDLVNGTEADSAARLLSLSTLLNAILYTQGNTGVEGELQELEMFATNCCSTRTTARVLKPLVEALTTTGGGRFEQVKTAVERGLFNDLRLIEPAMRALDDTYPELAQLAAEKILPAYGPGIIPLLKKGFELKGKKSDARRLPILHELDSAGTIDLCKKALEEGSPEVKVSAIACLAKHDDCQALVLEQASAKNKTVRAAALEALAQHEEPAITRLFTELIKGNTLELLARPFRAMRNRQVLNALLTEGNRVFKLLSEGDAEQIPRFGEILDCMQQRKDNEAEAFLLNCLEQSDKLGKVKAAKNSPIAGADIVVRLAGLLYKLGSPKALEAVLTRREQLPASAFRQVLHSALRLWPADKVYREFSPVLDQKKGAGKEKSQEIQLAIWTGRHADDSNLYAQEELNPDTADDQALKNIEWDPRWLDAAIKGDHPVIVCCLARPGHPASVAYLLKLLDAKNQTQIEMIIDALGRCKYPQLTEVFLDQVSKRAKSAQHFNWELQQLFKSACHLPASELSRLDAFAASLDEKFVDKFLEALEPLRPQRPNP